MKARVVGTNDVFADIEKVVINGVTYMPEVLEFEVDDNYDYVYTSSNVVDWGKVRIKASIAAMQGTITILSSSDRYAFTEVVVEGFRGEQKTYPNEIAQFSVAVADALIKELKGE